MTIFVKAHPRCQRCGGNILHNYDEEFCVLCSRPYEEGERDCCEACGIICGAEHDDIIYSYKEHQICGHCILAWKRLDTIIRRETTFKEFCVPDLLFLKGGREEE